MTVCGGYLLPGHLGSPQGSPGPALEGTRRVPEGQPGMSCHPTHLCDIWNKVGLWCGFVGVGGWGGALGPRRTCPLVSHTSQEAGGHPGESEGWDCCSLKLPAAASEHLAQQLRPVSPRYRGPGARQLCPS